MRGICKLSLERKIPEICIITYIHTCMCICKLEIYYKIKSNDFIIKQNAIILLIWKLAIWRSHFEIRPVCCFKSLTITTNSFSSACDPWDFTICIRCKSPSMPNRSPDGPKDCQSEVPGPKTPLPDPDLDRNPKTTNPALQVQRERLGFKRTSEANLTRVNQDEPRQGQIQFDGQGKTFEL